VGGKKSIIRKYSGNKKTRISAGFRDEEMEDVDPLFKTYQILRASVTMLKISF